MLRYTLLNAIRNIKRNPGFSIINITGLSLTMILVLVLLAWLRYELSFDRFNTNSKKIFRVVVDFSDGKSIDKFAHTPAPLGEALKNNIPEIADYVRLGSMGRILVSTGKDQFSEEIMLADPSLFSIFSFQLISGNRSTALANPGSVVINESTALKYFGNSDPTGKTIYFDFGDTKKPYIITGVVKDAPKNSQIQYSFLCSFSEIRNNLEWGSWNYTTYILASNDHSYGSISNKLSEFFKQVPDGERCQLHIQPLTWIHLHSRLRSDFDTNTDIRIFYIAASVLLLVLFVACINYMNLATARFTIRGKESGIRKVSGATNRELRIQYLSESIAITTSAFLIAVLLSWFLMPLIKLVVDLPVSASDLITPGTIAVILLLLIIISFISGSYPAMILSGVKPAASIRSEVIRGKAGTLKNLRRALVIFQFMVSIILVACTLVVRSQMKYVENKELGLVHDQVIVVPIYQSDVKSRYEIFKKEILRNPQINNASAMCYFPGRQGYYQNVWWEGLEPDDNNNMINWIPVDNDFVKTLKIELTAGEDFRKDSQDQGIQYILNESAVKMTGWNDPIGKEYDIIGKGRVAGIVKDFNFKSLHTAVEPVALVAFPRLYDNLMIKVSSGDIREVITFLKMKWEVLFPGTSFEYTFLSEDFQKMYEKDTTIMQIITFVSILSLFISCIGLFGLVVFTTDSKTREIGIRKVAGSTSAEIIYMLNMEFIKWILISLLISVPVIALFMQRWLDGFAYRINLSLKYFVIAGALTIMFTLLTTSWHTWRIGRKNPADCLRHE
ncbi:MAG TPA: ABC transporter permease [Bacteroidales bacterium]|nr:ABC transporter permease [Bacteroidales bacterium]